MGFDFGGISGGLLKILTSFLFWGLVLIAIVGGTMLSLIIRKKRKLIYPIMIFTDLGAGKMGIKARLKNGAGWFKKKTMFFGLFDYGGEDILRTWDKREIQNASSEDFHDINGKRGLVVIRKSDDPSILLPVNKAGMNKDYNVGKDGDLIPVKNMKVTNPIFLTQIAPADFRDASAKILDNNDKETMSRWQKVAPYIALGFIAIVLLICIIFIVQMVRSSQTESTKMVLDMGKMVKEGFCQSVQASVSAP